MKVIERSDTLSGPTIFFKKDEESCFSLTINQSGILLSDNISEIQIEIGESGEEGNFIYTDDIDTLTDKEISLIYEIAIYQYKEFEREKEKA